MRALLALCLALPGAAQATSAADCVTLGAAARPLAAEFGVTLPPLLWDGTACFWDRLAWTAAGDFGQRVTVERVTIQGEALDRLVRPGLPDRLEVQLQGLQVGAKVPDAVMAWVFELQGRRNRIDLTLALAFDAPARRLVIERAEADFPGDNRIALTATALGVDFSDADAAMAGMGGLTVPEARLEIETNGLFEAYALMPLSTAWLAGEDPAAAMAGVQAAMTGYLDALPPVFAPGGREALAAAIGDLPAPSGTLTVTLTAPESALPGQAWRFLTEGVAVDWPAALAGLTVGATWERTEE